mmetsp:Transcript_12751/g.20421  ORF Transcript_12751/g.20421 Transcript_12751/m.20421 type:complete len:292 (+) Transcript_12751:57-932(+)
MPLMSKRAVGVVFTVLCICYFSFHPKNMLEMTSTPRVLRDRLSSSRLLITKSPSFSGKRMLIAAKAKYAPVLEIEGEWDFWKLDSAVKAIKEGGIVVLPTDSCYTFVADVNSRDAVQRIYTIKDMKDPITAKPLSLLCHSISQISEYTSGLSSRSAFKIIKQSLPGPYTFILPASNKLPKIIIEHKEHKRGWRRKEIGVRMPKEPIVLEFLKLLDNPVLCSSVPVSRDSKILATEGAQVADVWAHCVDFVIDAGERDSNPSTVVDMTDDSGKIRLLREGAGDTEIFRPYLE